MLSCYFTNDEGFIWIYYQIAQDSVKLSQLNQTRFRPVNAVKLGQTLTRSTLVKLSQPEPVNAGQLDPLTTRVSRGGVWECVMVRGGVWERISIFFGVWWHVSLLWFYRSFFGTDLWYIQYSILTRLPWFLLDSYWTWILLL